MLMWRTTLIIGVVWGLAPFGACAQAQTDSAPRNRNLETIRTPELVDLLAAHRQRAEQCQREGRPIPEADFVLVDVREDKEIAVSMIPGAITKADFEENADRYRQKLIVPYCVSGRRSEAYARRLLENGWNTKSYAGSISEWVQAELPLVTPRGEPTRRVFLPKGRYQIPPGYEQVSD